MAKIMNNAPGPSKPLLRLIRLINVMTSGQKRVFKRDATSWRDSKEAAYYVRLFDEICKHLSKHEVSANANLSETLLQKMEKKQKSVVGIRSTVSVNARDISVRANYLFDKILESMRFAGTKSSTFKDLNGKMQDVYFLFNNDLTDDCIRLIDETLDLAKSIDRPAYTLELCALKRRILISKNSDGATNTQLKEIVLFEDEAQEHLILYNKLTSLNNQLLTLRIHNASLPEALMAEIESIVSRYENTESGARLGVRTRFQLFMLISEFNKSKSILNGGAHYVVISNTYEKKSYELLKSEPTFKEDEFPMYQIRISSYLIELVKNKNFSEAEKELSEIERSDDKLFLYRTLAYLRIQIFNEQDRYSEAAKYISEIKLAAGLRLYNNQIWTSRIITLEFLGAYVFVMLNNYTEANKWAKMIMQDNRIKVAPNLRVPILFIHLICLFEMFPKKTEEELLRAFTNEYRKFTKKYTEPNQKPLLTFGVRLKNLFQLFITEKKMDRHFSESLKQRLLMESEKLRNETRENAAFQPFRIPIAWLLSKLNNSKISEEMK